MRFMPGWDQMLINELKRLPPKSALSTLPPGFNPLTEERDSPTYNEMVFSFFFRNLPIHRAHSYSFQHHVMPKTPKPTPFLAGGVLFGPGSINDMKFDPYFYFHCEEFTMNLRLWTRGYTNYSPRFSFCWHSYRLPNVKRTTFIHEINPTLDSYLHERSMSRYQVLVGLKQAAEVPLEHLIELEHFGMGFERPIKSWEETYGIWLHDQRVEPWVERIEPENT